MHRNLRRLAAATAATAVGAGVLALGTPAQAATVTTTAAITTTTTTAAAAITTNRIRIKCTVGHFLGWVDVYGHPGWDRFFGYHPVATVTDIKYTIFWYSHKSRRHNNVVVYDDFYTPHYLGNSGDSAVSDGQPRELKPYGTNKAKNVRLNGLPHILHVDFIFDQKGPDPKCSNDRSE
jgi:hypothetical protein